MRMYDVKIPAELYDSFVKWRLESRRDADAAVDSVVDVDDSAAQFHSPLAHEVFCRQPDRNLGNAEQRTDAAKDFFAHHRKPEKRMAEDSESGEAKPEKPFCDECFESDDWNDCDEVISQLSETIYREKRINDALLQLIELMPETK